MVGGLVVTLTGAIKIAFRFVNKMLGFLLIFTGAWFALAVQGAYQGYLLYQARKSGLPFWLTGSSAPYGENKVLGTIILIVSIGGSLCLFLYNCYRFYTAMPDNFLKRLIMLFFSRNYRPEREGNNIPDYMRQIKRRDTGFYFGKKRVGIFEENVVHVGKPTGADGHILVVGGAGSGKSAAIAKNTLETWNAPIFALDIKGELSAHLHKLRLKSVNDCKRWHIVFDPTHENARQYDPYYLLRNSGAENLTQYAREIAIAIIPLPPGVRDPFWIQSAQNVLTAAILYYFDIGNSFTDTMVAIQTTPIDKLIDEISESGNISAKMFVNQVRDLELKTLAGIGTELSNKIMVFATDPLIRAAIADSQDNERCFNWNDLEASDIFLRLPEDKIEQWGSVITLMVSQLIRTLERRADNTSAEGKTPPTLLLLDEIARVGKIEAIKNALATLRSKNVTVSLFIQSLAQLDAIYGEAERRIIVDNCRYKAILNATDADSQAYFSRLVGTCEVEKESRGVQYDVDEGIETGRGSHWSKTREPIIHPHEFAALEDVILITPKGFCRVEKVFAPGG